MAVWNIEFIGKGVGACHVASCYRLYLQSSMTKIGSDDVGDSARA
jgi:hypothetical protein